jgi:hypothetical protein
LIKKAAAGPKIWLFLTNAAMSIAKLEGKIFI